MKKPVPMFTAVQEDGDSLVTFYEGPNRSGRVLAYWFRDTGNLSGVSRAGTRWIGRTADMDTAGRIVSRYRKSL